MTTLRRRAPDEPSRPEGYPSWLERELVLLDGRRVTARPVLPTDAEELRRAVAEADPETLRLRFLGARPPRTDEEFRRLVEVDYERRLALVARDPEDRGVAIARYESLGDGPLAEIAVAVDPGWRHVGLGTALVRLLAEGALTAGISGFTAEFFADNVEVRDLIAESGADYRSRTHHAGTVEVEVDVSLPSDAADSRHAPR